MARAVKSGREDRAELDDLGASVVARLTDVPWELFDSKDLASSGETRYMVSRIQEDLLKVAAADPARAGRIWDHNVPGFVPRPAELPDVEMIPAPENSIEPGRRRRKGNAEPFLDPSEAIGQSQAEKVADRQTSEPRARQPRDGDKPAKEPDNSARVQMLLDGLSRQYVHADDKYHFRDKGGAVAFEAQEKKLLTQHEAPAVVSSMVDLAEARGWSSLNLSGSQDFKREAWLQASARGLEVSGYKPNDLDRARLRELQSERLAPHALNTIAEERPRPQQRDDWKARFEPVPEEGRSEPRIPLTPGQDQFLRAMEATMRHRGDSGQAVAKARELAADKLTSDRVHVGTLVEVGTAPYQDKRGASLSHFVTLEDEKGQKSKVWGVDLQRALKTSGAELGEKVAVVFKGHEPVKVEAPVRDGQGRVVRIEHKTVERNTWEVVQFDRLRDDARASVAKAVERQENPAGLKVFDRSAPSVAREPQPVRTRERGRERSV